MNKKFAIFILSHGRPDNVITYTTLKKAGYTGDIYIVIDNEDKSAEKYYNNFGDKVIMFDKKAIAKTFDEADNFEDRRSIVYARNFCFEIANDLKLDYFMQLDDDYFEFNYRFDNKLNYVTNRYVGNLDNILSSMVKFMESNKQVSSIAMAQTGDFIGGANGGMATKKTLKRKAMNTFLCNTKRPFKFKGRINEDVNTYTSEASKGMLFFTIPHLAINQKNTQSNKGGMSDIYENKGTYVKSFYSVLFQPSSVKVSLMGDKHMRLHHRVSWKHTTPVILEEKYKK